MNEKAVKEGITERLNALLLKYDIDENYVLALIYEQVKIEGSYLDKEALIGLLTKTILKKEAGFLQVKNLDDDIYYEQGYDKYDEDEEQRYFSTDKAIIGIIEELENIIIKGIGYLQNENGALIWQVSLVIYLATRYQQPMKYVYYQMLKMDKKEPLDNYEFLERYNMNRNIVIINIDDPHFITMSFGKTKASTNDIMQIGLCFIKQESNK